MDQKNINTKITNEDSEGQQKKDIILFLFVMVIFTIGMALLLIYNVSAWWIWYIYLGIWTLIEYKIAKNIKLKWWWWLLIIIMIVLIDLIVLELIE